MSEFQVVIIHMSKSMSGTVEESSFFLAGVKPTMVDRSSSQTDTASFGGGVESAQKCWFHGTI